MPQQEDLPGINRCRWCEKEAVYLCDKPTGLATTCDAPMCEKHRHKRGQGIACQRSGRGRGCHPFTIDYCPNHAGHE